MTWNLTNFKAPFFSVPACSAVAYMNSKVCGYYLLHPSPCLLTSPQLGIHLRGHYRKQAGEVFTVLTIDLIAGLFLHVRWLMLIPVFMVLLTWEPALWISLTSSLMYVSILDYHVWLSLQCLASFPSLFYSVQPSLMPLDNFKSVFGIV